MERSLNELRVKHILQILAVCQAGFNIAASTVWGYGYHRADLPPHIRDASTPKVLFYINQIFFKVETGCTKLSICVIYINIFRHATLRRVLVSQAINYLLCAVVISYYMASSFISALQCAPLHKAWQSNIQGTCIDNDKFRIANGYINCLTSAWIIIMPFPVLLSLQNRKRELVEFLGLVALGVMYVTTLSSYLALYDS